MAHPLTYLLISSAITLAQPLWSWMNSGKMISYEEYYPYGSTSYQAVRSQTETPKRYRFTGKERYDKRGLRITARGTHAPWLGRWVSGDPVGLTDESIFTCMLTQIPSVLLIRQALTVKHRISLIWNVVLGKSVQK